MPNAKPLGHLGEKLRIAMNDKGVSQAEVARVFGVSPPAVNKDWLKFGRIHKKHYQRLVEYFEKPYEWWFGGRAPKLDTRVSLPDESTKDGDVYVVQRLAIQGSAGNGVEAADEERVIERMTLTGDWVQMRLPRISSPLNLKVISALGDSMQPTFNDGDLLLVDTGIKAVDIDGVYVLRAQKRLFIKRVRQKLDGKFMVSSDNPASGTPEELNGKFQVEIQGRVVWAWNGKKL